MTDEPKDFIDEIDHHTENILNILDEDERDEWRLVLRLTFSDWQDQRLCVNEWQRERLAVALRTLERPEREFIGDLLSKLLALYDRVNEMDRLTATVEPKAREMGWLGPKDEHVHWLIGQYRDIEELTYGQIAKKLNGNPHTKKENGEWTDNAVKKHCQKHGIEKGKSRRVAEETAEMNRHLKDKLQSE